MTFDMEARINIDLVAYACGRAITCKGCGNVLDVSTSVLVSPVNREGMTILCKPCWVKVKHAVRVAVEVTNGGNGSVTVHQPVSQAEPVKSEADISGEQLELLP